MRGGVVLGEVPVLGKAPALKVRPKRNFVPAVAGERAGQAQIGRGADEDGQAELRADHPRGPS